MTLNDKKGITLIEVVIVLAIIAILASLTAVGPGFIRNENISRVSRELLGDLQRARQDAMTRSEAPDSRGFGIRFASNTSYVIFEFSDINTNFQYDGTGEEANTNQRNLTSSIEYQINGANPNNNILVYDKLGIPRRDTWGMWTSITFVVRHQSDNSVQAKCVSVSTNRIREGLWDGSTCQEQ
ncbi:MAG: hypothetical protein COS40_11170 [Deltaproteobacteria bacterium CG03_land_8_20_14_0_80_45_14]|nr:MAG: hypothetical protein COS40_11170 [Deltaproteobacteria bacterium CG03_land_8_20_14_0_80_45_14]